MPKERDFDAAFRRIDAILGGGEDQTFGEQVAIFYEHLKRSLSLPCRVTGTEDFRWEERYVFGAGDLKEYKRLRKTHPSYQDEYDLLAIEQGAFSEWMLFSNDLGAYVRRVSDGKEFLLGLAELKAVDEQSKEYQLLDDYAVFFVNSRRTSRVRNPVLKRRLYCRRETSDPLAPLRATP